MQRLIEMHKKHFGDFDSRFFYQKTNTNMVISRNSNSNYITAAWFDF